MDDQSRLRLEYEAASELLRGLTETRFKLLALVPTLAGAVVAFATAHRTGVALFAIGLLGLAATFGVLVYELRNGEIKGEVACRVRELEQALLPGGQLVARSRARFLGTIPVSHSLGIGLVYGAAIGGWCYLAAWGALRSLWPHWHVQSVGLAIGAAAGLAAAMEIVRIELTLERAGDAGPPGDHAVTASEVMGA